MVLKTFSKKELRKSVYDSRNRINQDIKKNMDFNIFNILVSSEEYKQSNKLFTYISRPIEVNTYSIMKNAFKGGKDVIVPKCNTESSIMSFYRIKSFNDLKKGYFQIYEPIEEKCEEILDFSCGVCIVPGLCFDIYGFRIGYGKGYYDRFLRNFKGIKIGICYSDYIFKKLPIDIYDEKVDILVTEKNILEVIV